MKCLHCGKPITHDTDCIELNTRGDVVCSIRCKQLNGLGNSAFFEDLIENDDTLGAWMGNDDD